MHYITSSDVVGYLAIDVQLQSMMVSAFVVNALFSSASLSKYVTHLVSFSYHLNQTKISAALKGKNSHPALCLIL